MGKKKQEDFDEEEDFDNSSFNLGVLRGMYTCHDITHEAITRLRKSLEDVWSIEWNGTITPEKKAYIDKLNFAIDTLVTANELFQDEYDVKIDELKARTESEEEYLL